jgi:diphosphomevalonate decarboxylase
MIKNVSAESEANANIALIKYWGKLDRAGNYPAVPSLSLTLEGLCTRTRVELDRQLRTDEVLLDGELCVGRPRDRVVAILNEFRRIAKNACFARVTSQNDFPTAAGLASSASGFAALVTAADRAFATDLDRPSLSALARSASASAARSLFGGWSVLLVGADAAAELAPPNHWSLVLLVAVTARGKKPIGSSEAMEQTRSTSPYYDAWVTHAPSLFEEAEDAVLCRDLGRLGAAMEQSTLMMHATMLAARAGVCYFVPGTLNVIDRVRSLRSEDVPCYFTIDAGPHVKVLCNNFDADRVRTALLGVDGVLDVLVAQPGRAARVQVSP